MIRIRVNGVPAPQGSKRHVGGGHMVESSRAVGPWREAVRAEAQRALSALPDNGCASGHGAFCADLVFVTAVFLLPRPTSHYSKKRLKVGEGKTPPLLLSAPRFPGTRPDLDKLLRSTLDGLTDAGVWRDDAQVVSISAGKVYCRDGEAPGVIIEVEGAGT